MPLIRTSLLFALWTVACVAVAVIALLALFDQENLGKWRWLRDVGAEFAMFAIPAAVTAAAGWAVLHRNGRRPGIFRYGALALIVVIVTQILGLSIQSTNARDVRMWIVYSPYILIFHGWLTGPLAFGATALFVRWERRRRAAAGLSVPLPAASRS